MSKIKVVADWSGEKMEIDLCDTEEQMRSMTVKQLKEKIAERIPEYADKSGVPTIELGGHSQLRDSNLLSECGIQHMSVVQIVCKIMVKSLGGWSMVVSPYEKHMTVSDLNARIQASGGIPPDMQRLIAKGKILVDYRLLSSYGIRHMDTVYLSIRLRGGLDERKEGKIVGGMGDKEGRNLSMENLADFKTYTFLTHHERL